MYSLQENVLFQNSFTKYRFIKSKMIYTLNLPDTFSTVCVDFNSLCLFGSKDINHTYNDYLVIALTIK